MRRAYPRGGRNDGALEADQDPDLRAPVLALPTLAAGVRAPASGAAWLGRSAGGERTYLDEARVTGTLIDPAQPAGK